MSLTETEKKPKSKPKPNVKTQVKTIKGLVVKKSKKNANAAAAIEAVKDLVPASIPKPDDRIKPTDSFIEAPWIIIESYFSDNYQKKLVRHQLESYNHFTNFQLEQTISMFNPMHIKSEKDSSVRIELHFDNLRLNRPQIHENNGSVKTMFPQEARLRNFTYASAMTVNINAAYTLDGVNDSDGNPVVHHKILPNIHIGKLPIMVKSDMCVLTTHPHLDHMLTGECRYDPGGYFIINGSEKVVIGQIRPAENRVYCYKSTVNKYLWVAEIRSVPDYKCISPKQTNMMISSRSDGFGFAIYVECPRIKKPVPLFILFRALGVCSDKKICDYILADTNDATQYTQMQELLKASIIEANGVHSEEAATNYVMDCVSYHTPIAKSSSKPSVETTKSIAEDQIDTAPVIIPDDNAEIIAKRLVKRRQFTQVVLSADIFPHCPTFCHKAHFLGHMAGILCKTHLKIRNPDDRDTCENQRVDTTGVSVNNLMRNYFNKVTKDMERHIIKEIECGIWRSTEDYTNIINMTNIYHMVKSNTIENGIKRALSTGDFSIKHNNASKVGVAQVLNRLTYLAGLSHERRIAAPPDKSGKLIPPRKLHGSSWGFYCPSETPEGHAVGIVKNMSSMAHITIASDSRSLYDYVMPHIIPVGKFSLNKISGIVKVFINGTWVGIIPDQKDDGDNIPAFTLYKMWKQMKYSGIINVYTSIVFDMSTLVIRLCSDAGRMARPVMRVIDGQILFTRTILRQLETREITWDDLLIRGAPENEGSGGIIEYIDAEEQSYAFVATKLNDLMDTKKHYTHCEIHPSTIFGIIASCIPFPDHNQSPRVTYQAAQQKQAVGKYVTNYANRMDKTAYVMAYPMRPLIDTRLMNLLKLNELPSGCTVTVAIMTHTGYNQEDSILINQGAIDRGLFQLNIYHTEKDEDKQKINGDEEIRCKPDKKRTRGTKCGNYEKVNAKGIMPENTLVENGDIIIAKVVPIKGNKTTLTEVVKYEDRSKIHYTNEATYIDKNYIERNGDGYTFAKVRLRALRQPVIGDKFSSRHGQKGTVGNIIPEADMPFDENGERPDVIINPHAIPSRMTIGHLTETLLGQVLIHLGLFGDGTSFGDMSVKDISNHLMNLGYESNGDKVLMNGLTGEQIECNIFMGPVFYQRLKHMVEDKQHSRSTGTMVKLTRQPPEGRSRGGGLRFGEMEKDAMVSHGAARFARERLYDVSDKYDVHVCKKCGMIAAYNNDAEIHLCRTCDNRSDFRHVQIPYACKALFQELMTMNICPRIMTK